MLEPETPRYTKLRWSFTVLGLILYVLDIGTDVRLVVKYFVEGEYLWMGLTLAFILAGVLVTQTFSFAWERDDVKQKAAAAAGVCKRQLALHLFGVGIFMRYAR